MNKKIISLIILASIVMSGCQSATQSKVTTSSQAPKVTDTAKKDASEMNKRFKSDFIISAEDLKAKLSDKNVIIVDARGKKNASLTGFIKNSILMTWQDIADVADKKPGQEGWGHIMSKETLGNKLSELGLDKNKGIILYSNSNAGWGEDGRIMWELRAAGYNKLKMVDGGIEAIKKLGIELVKDEAKPQAVEVKIDNIDYKNSINTTDLTKEINKYKLIDSREADEYKGATKFGEAKGGHIKGAKNIAYSSLYNKDGMLKSNEELEKLFADQGFKKDDMIVTYCTGGIRSAYMQLIMESLGYKNVKNYEGSYYNWAAINPVEK